MAAVIPSRDRIIQEVVRCAKDPIYFIKNYVYIQHPQMGKIKFNTYDFQDACVKEFLNHRFNIVLKARQLGLSTLVAAYCLWLSIFHKNKSILVLATKLDVAQNFIKKVKFMKDSLPPFLAIAKVTGESKKHLEFSNGSQVKAIPTTDDAGRSEALTLLIVDEAAFIEGFEEIYKSIFPTLSAGGSAIMISSPRGTAGVFYDTWIAAESKKNEYNPIKLMWNVHPDRDEVWYKSQAANMTPKDLAQEHNCDFTTSGDTFLAAGDIQWVKSCIQHPIEMTGPSRDIWVWKHPSPEHKYLISADVARGTAEGDFSTFQVIDITENEQVAEYQGKLPPEKLHEPMIEMGNLYNTALICVENNSFGYSTAVELKKSKYPRLYYEDYARESLAGLPITDDETLPGYYQHLDRDLVMNKMDSLIRNKIIKLYSSRLVRELETFITNTRGKAVASKGKRDDLVMALAIGIWISEMGFSGITVDHLELAKTLLAHTGVSSKQVSLPGLPRPQQVFFGNTSPITGNGLQPRSDAYKEAMSMLPRGAPTNPYDFSWMYQGLTPAKKKM
jgi:hypothetical protein